MKHSASRLTKAYPAHFKSVVKEGSLVAKQVFSVDETGLYWKKLCVYICTDTEEKECTWFQI